jgi:hypothetical protein
MEIPSHRLNLNLITQPEGCGRSCFKWRPSQGRNGDFCESKIKRSRACVAAVWERLELENPEFFLEYNRQLQALVRKGAAR